jgi:hypothetical protein
VIDPENLLKPVIAEDGLQRGAEAVSEPSAAETIISIIGWPVSLCARQRAGACDRDLFGQAGVNGT